MSHKQLKPKGITHIHLDSVSSSRRRRRSRTAPQSQSKSKQVVFFTNEQQPPPSTSKSSSSKQEQVMDEASSPPVSTINVMHSHHHHDNFHSCQSSLSSFEETPTSPSSNNINIMNAPSTRHLQNTVPNPRGYFENNWTTESSLLRTSTPPPAFHKPATTITTTTAASNSSTSNNNNDHHHSSSSSSEHHEVKDGDNNWDLLQKSLAPRSSAATASTTASTDPYTGGQSQEATPPVANPFVVRNGRPSYDDHDVMKTGRNNDGNDDDDDNTNTNNNNNNNNSSHNNMPRPILRRRPSNNLKSSNSNDSNSNSSLKHQERQQLEIQSIIQTLEDLQNNFISNDNSTHSSNPQSGYSYNINNNNNGNSNNSSRNNNGNNNNNNNGNTINNNNNNKRQRQKEYTIRHFPNGDLFSGNVDAETGELIYGRMTCALEMETYEGPFWRGERHGEGAVCNKMDGGAKFLGRYHEGQMHSGTLIVTRSLPSDFTYTGTFFNNDFHGVGTIVSQNGSIYQGQFQHGQYHGVGTLRTICDDDDVNDDDDDDERGNGNSNNNIGDSINNRSSLRGGNNDKGSSCRRGREKMESVYTGDFSEGLFHGSGSLTHSDGSSYVGTWSEGKRVEGTEILLNGEIFEGTFLDDLREGHGVLKMKCGRMTKRGVWERDVLKEGVDLNITFGEVGEGHVYCGDHANSVPHGFGRMEYGDMGSGQSAYTGWFANGFRQGVGRCFFHTSGEEYEGEWACDEPVNLKIFQHDGPLISGSSGSLTTLATNTAEMTSSRGEGVNNVVETTRSQCSTLDSSLVSVGSSGATACSVDTEESIVMSSIDNGAAVVCNNTISQTTKKSQPSCQKNGISASDTEDLSLSMKSLSVFDYSESHKVYRYRNGDVFKGRLDEVTNLRQGSGVYTEHRMGSVYNGDWKDSKRHGVGHLKLASGADYSGEFFEDKIHGQGSLTLINGSVYTGSFFNGLFHGRGMLEDVLHNSVYFGEFENGERSGSGEEQYPDGSQYKGEYKRGKRNGVGVHYEAGPNGNSPVELYRGEWHEDLRQGKGLLMRHRHEGLSWEGSYDGDFFQDKFSGNGKYTYTDGTSIEGQWMDAVPRDGDWSIRYPDGSKFYGFATFQHPEEKSIMSDGSSSREMTTITSKSRDFLRVPLPHGFGSLTYPSGQRFVGSFVYGEYSDGTGKR